MPLLVESSGIFDSIPFCSYLRKLFCNLFLLSFSSFYILQLHHQRQRLSVGADVPTAALACDLVAEPVGGLCA